LIGDKSFIGVGAAPFHHETVTEEEIQKAVDDVLKEIEREIARDDSRGWTTRAIRRGRELFGLRGMEWTDDIEREFGRRLSRRT